VTPSDQLVEPIDLLATLGLFQCLSYISFGYNFEHSTSSFIQSIFAKSQFEFVVFVSYILYYILYCDLLSELKIYFLYFTN